MTRGLSRWHGSVTVTGIWMAAWAEVLMRDGYHALHAQTDNMAWLLAAPVVLLIDALILRRDSVSRRLLWPSWQVLMLSLWAWIVIWSGPRGQTFLAGVASVFLLWGGLWWLGRSQPYLADRWNGSRLPVALLVGAVLFVAVPPVLATFSSHPVQWPQAKAVPAPAATASGTGSPALLVLLFDELSEKSASPIRQVLTEEGLSVTSKAVRPVADGTAKVIPAMWLRRPFGEAKPCGFTAICSNGDLLDFAQVQVDRPDVDVVGFYHPYCAMKGLRWCRRESPLGLTEDLGRMTCGLFTRVGLSAPPRCYHDQHRGWAVLNDRVEGAYWEAPFWREGGMLYAHLPFPHPPASEPGATLVAHYATGIDRSAALVRRSVRKLRAAGHASVRVVVVSDHPLRIAEWCGNGTYSARRCEGAQALDDSVVPLIVGTTDEPVDLSPYSGNEQVFDLVSMLQARRL